MGFKKSWDAAHIKSQLQRMAIECAHPNNDGFIASGIKHELIEIQFMLEDMLERCPKFAGEEEWYHERMLEKLKR